MDPPKTRAGASFCCFWTVLGLFRGSKTRLWALIFQVFRTRAPKIMSKSSFFPHLAVKLVKKTSFSLVKYTVLAFPPRPKPRVLRCFKHFFSQKMQPIRRKWRFSPPEKVLWLEFWGSPSSLKVLKRPVFELVFRVFNDFEALKRAQKRPTPLKTPPKNPPTLF